MKKAISIAVCMAVSVSVFAQSSAFADEPVFSGEKETYIVLTETEKDGKKIQSQFDGEILLGDEAVSCELTEHQAERLEQQSGVIAVSEDIILEGSGKKSKKKLSFYPEQWNLEAIGADNSEAKPTGVKIEVLDSGVSYTDDINIMGEVNLVPGEEEVSPMFVDANGHGTGIAGLIGAKDNKDGIKGVFPDAKIYSVKAFDENLKSPLSRIVEGIYWGIENDMDIINMSFGTTVNSAVLHQAIKDAEAAGILLIAAAGNTEHQDINYPAAYDEVIAVGSINAEGKLAELTSTGTELELLAPGEQVCTTGLFYGTIGVSGTSIATAQVTGAAAMLKAKDKTKSNDFIRGLLKTSSKEVEGTNAGLIDCEYALEIYDEYSKSYTKGEKAVEKLENNEAVPDYSDQADIVVEGLWQAQTSLQKPLSSTHGQLVKYAVDKTTSKISTENLNYMARAANLADRNIKNKKGVDKNSNAYKYNYSDVKAYHGKANYVASLKFLWKYANLIGQKKSYADAKSITKTAIGNSKASQSEKVQIKFAIDATEFMLKEQTKALNKSLTAQNKKFLVMGFIMHLIGDTYAHATIVPKYTLNKVPKEDRHYKVAKFSSDPDDHKSRFGTDDFVATSFYYSEKKKIYEISKYDDAKKESEFNKRIEYLTQNADDYQGSLDWGCLYKATDLQVLTFRKIKFFMSKSSNSRYEDNVNFCPERYRKAKSVSKNYLNQYTKAFSNILISKGYVKLYKFDSYKDRK